MDLGLPRQIGDLLKIDEEPETKLYEVIRVIPEEKHSLPYGVTLPNPEMYECKDLGYYVYHDETMLVGRYAGDRDG